MSGKTAEKETLTSSALEKLIDWAFQTLISWSVILLTCFVGLIELLPQINLYSDNLWERLLFGSLSLIYLIFTIGLFYSLLRIGTLYAEIVELQSSLPEPMKQKIIRAPHIDLVLDKEGNLKKKTTFLLSSIVSTLWILALISKIPSVGLLVIIVVAVIIISGFIFYKRRISAKHPSSSAQ